MGDKVLLTVEERDVIGKKVSHLRSRGLVPGIIYGHDFKAKPIMAETRVVEKAYKLAGRHQPVELTVGKTKRLAMIKSTDYEPVKHKLRHISFQVIKQNEKVETEVPVEIENIGETVAEKAGLVVLKTIETVEIKALPADLPSKMFVPSSKLSEPGDHVTVADITLIDGVEILTDPEIVVASVYEPSALAAQNEDLAGEAESEAEVKSEHGEAESVEGEATVEDVKKEEK